MPQDSNLPLSIIRKLFTYYFSTFLYSFKRATCVTTQSKMVLSSRVQFFLGFWLLIILNQSYQIPLNTLMSQIWDVLGVEVIISFLILGFLEFGQVLKEFLILFEGKGLHRVNKFLQPFTSLIKRLYFFLVKIVSERFLVKFFWLAGWAFTFKVSIWNSRHEEVQYFDFINIKKNFNFHKNGGFQKGQLNLKIELIILMC